MRVVNNFFKFIAKLGVHLLCLFDCFLIGLVCTSILFSITMAVWSIFDCIPNIVSCYYWLVLIISSVPLTIIIFIVVELDLVKKNDYNEYLPKAFKK